MSILLPTSPGIRTAKPRLVDYGSVQTPPLGGVSQRLNRIGNRFSLDVDAATSSSIDKGRVLVSRLMQGMTQGVLLPFPQDFPNEATGAPVINGGGQQGSALQLHGFDPNAPIFEGQFFSLIFAGRRYLHSIAADTSANNQGAALISLFPMLRVSPNDGAVCEFAQPMIEGYLSGNALEYQLQTAAFVDVSFTITEAA